MKLAGCRAQGEVKLYEMGAHVSKVMANVNDMIDRWTDRQKM